MRTAGRWSLSSSRRASPAILPFVLLAAACGTATQLTPQQEWVMTKFAECKTRTNAINVRLDRVEPDGRWSATVAQTQSEYNHLVACMQDESVDATIYRRMADGGNVAAMSRLGRLYEQGRGGVTKDDVQAEQWYRRGAEAGNGQAMASLGLMYERGRGGLTKDADAAAQWYRKGAATGDEYAMYLMGRACEFGLGVTKDRAEAVQWYRKAAALGSPRASERLKALGD